MASAPSLVLVPASGLFRREPLGWGWETIRDLGAWLGDLFTGSGGGEGSILPGGELGARGLLLLILLGAAAAALQYLSCRRRRKAVDALAARLAPRLGKRAGEGIAATVSILWGAAVPLLLWAGLHLALESAPEHLPLLRVAARMARLHAVVTLLLLGYREFRRWGVLSLRTAEAPRLTSALWVLVSFIIVLRLLIIATIEAGARPDLLALIRFAFHAGLLLILGAILLNRRLVLSSLPMIQTPLFLRFLGVLHRFYYPALAFSAAVAAGWLAGYESLARFLLLRVWALVGLFLALLYADRILSGALRRLIEGPPEEEPSAGARAARSSAMILVRIGETVAGIVLALRLLDLLLPTVDLLSVPLFALLGQQVTLLLLLQVAVVLAVAFVLASLIGRILEDRILPGLGVESGTGTAVGTGIRYLLVAVGLLVALETAGFDFRVLAVFAGALGIGAGFGLQRFASNLVSGLVMIFGRVVRRGDIVTVGNEIGMIQEVGIRATVLRSLDNIEFIVPNDNLINETIINWTYTDSSVRLHLPVGVSYGSDPEQVREVLLEVAAAHPQVRKRPAPTVWFVGYGDSSIDFELLAWMDVKKISRKQLASDIYFATFRALKERGIEIPFPQRDLHLKSGWAPAGVESAGREGGGEEPDDG